MLRSDGKVAGNGAGYSPEEAIRVAVDLLRERLLPAQSPFEQWRGHLKHLEGQDVDELVRDWRGE